MTRSPRQKQLIAALFAIVASFAAIALTASLTQLIVETTTPLYLVASMGAAAVLVFCLPSSPMSQPWPLIGGHLVSVSIGILCYQWLGNYALSAAAAVALSITAMYLLRCLHPPGGAIALAVVIGSSELHQLGYSFIAMPVMINATIILFCSIGYRQLLKKISTHSNGQTPEKTEALLPFNNSDLKAALSDHGILLDISEQDLNSIYHLAEQQSLNRRRSTLCCADYMKKNVITVQYGDELEKSWQLLSKNDIHGLPVVDTFQRVIGIVTRSDFLRLSETVKENTLHARLYALIKKTVGDYSDKAEHIGQIMKNDVTCIKEETTLGEAMTIFTEKSIHHLPVINDTGKLVGMITRSDIITALNQQQ